MYTLSDKSSHKRSYFYTLTLGSMSKEEQQTLISVNYRLDNLFGAFLKDINAARFLNSYYFKKAKTKQNLLIYSYTSIDVDKFNVNAAVATSWNNPELNYIKARIDNNNNTYKFEYSKKSKYYKPTLEYHSN